MIERIIDLNASFAGLNIAQAGNINYMQIIYNDNIKSKIDRAIEDTPRSINHIELKPKEFKSFYEQIILEDLGAELKRFEYNTVKGELLGRTFSDTVTSFTYRDTRIRVERSNII